MDTVDQKNKLIEEAVRVELGENGGQYESDLSDRIRFWQSQSPTERITATTEITRRVYIARGGKIDDFKVNKNFARFVKWKS